MASDCKADQQQLANGGVPPLEEDDAPCKPPVGNASAGIHTYTKINSKKEEGRDIDAVVVNVVIIVVGLIVCVRVVLKC